MNDFLIAQLAREHMNRIARQAEFARLIRAAELDDRTRPVVAQAQRSPMIATSKERRSVETEHLAEEACHVADDLVVVDLVEDLVGRALVGDVLERRATEVLHRRGATS